MAGYTRQSTGSIINGSPITAPPLNSEFNQVAAAFNATSGHSHDGSTGNSPKINLTTSVSGYLPAVHGGIGGKNKLDATTTPIVTNDNSEGYAPGSLWENTTTGRVYICVGNSTGAAVWRELVQVNSGTAILPAATDTVDLGDNSNRFQDLFLSGGISASGNVAAGGTLNITGATALGSTLGVTGDTTLVNLAATGTTTITSIDLNSGAIDSTTIGTTTPAAGTFTTLNANTSLVAATADINGGTVDGATIGVSTPSTGAFTTLGASGTSTLATVDINGGNIDGTAIGAAVQSTGAFTTVSSSGQATLATVDINGGSIDGATIGANATSSGAFTTLSASGGITGDIVGDVTGNSAGTHTGAVVGNVTGDLTGNVTAASGTSSFNNVTIDGTLNMNAGTSATIQNLTAPTNDLDAATKKYVDDEISTLIGDAGAGLNTLGELADALNDDDDFSTTVTNSIATKLPKAGGTMTGAIAMSTNKITGVGDPTSAQDVATKVYTDTQRDTRVAKTGDSMSGALAMGSNKITGLGTPTAATDATTKTYVDGILGSATVAATSASNAATSESNAATSETNASNSATAAASSSASAAASLDSFDDRYLGAKSSAPTVDNDGDALIVGALYFDSTAGAMKVYSANGWTNAGSSVNGTTNRYSYTATAGQTVFAATYDAGYVDIFLNGVKQLVGTDVTATSGTSVVFASATTVNDIVEIVGYGTFVLADHLTQTQSDARYVNLSGDTMTGDLNFGDNDKAVFGAGSDLQIYHNGSHSYIDDVGGGVLILQTDGNNVSINSTGKNMGVFTKDAEVTLYYNNSPKIATSNTGVDITGRAVTDGVTVDGYLDFQTDGTFPTTGLLLHTNNHFYMRGGSNGIIFGDPSGNEYLRFTGGTVFNEGGLDRDFRVESDSNTHMLFVDAGNNRIGINESSPDAFLDISGTGATTSKMFEISTGGVGGGPTSTFYGGYVQVHANNNATDNFGWHVTAHHSGIDSDTTGVYGQATMNSSSNRSIGTYGVSSVNSAAVHNSPGTANSKVAAGVYAEAITTGTGSNSTNAALIANNKTTSGSLAYGAFIKVNSGATNPVPLGVDYDGYNVFDVTASDATFNEDGIDRDFRVESDTNSHCFYVDAGANAILMSKTLQSIGATGVSIVNGQISATVDGADTLRLNRLTSTGSTVQFRYASNIVGSVSVDASGTTYNTSSDRRLKTDIQPIANGTDMLMAMNPVTHGWKADPNTGETVHGFIAQEMQDIVPEAVSGDPDGEEMMSMDYGRITPVLVAALQEATNEIKALKQRVSELEAK